MSEGMGASVRQVRGGKPPAQGTTSERMSVMYFSVSDSASYPVRRRLDTPLL